MPFDPPFRAIPINCAFNGKSITAVRLQGEGDPHSETAQQSNSAHRDFSAVTRRLQICAGALGRFTGDLAAPIGDIQP